MKKSCRKSPRLTVEQNERRATELVDRVLNGHDLDALTAYTSNPAVIASAFGLLTGFSDLEVTVRWMVGEGDMAVFFFDMHGTHDGSWLFVPEASRLRRGYPRSQQDFEEWITSRVTLT